MGLCARYSASGVYYGRSINAASVSVKMIDLISESTPPNIRGAELTYTNYTNYVTINTWYRQELTAYGNALYYWHEHENKSINTTDSSWTTGTWGIFGAYNTALYTYFKDVTVGKYISPEPAWGNWGEEEVEGIGL